MATDTSYVGVDGAPDGWIAVRYGSDGFVDVRQYEDADALWADNRTAEAILVDVPIGLREDSAEPRACDAAARAFLSPRRHTSVFPVPIREAVYADSYEDAKETQEEQTDGSLGTQSYAIADKIRQLDELLREGDGDQDVVRESHPEVCFTALNDGEPMTHSKTGQPAAAFWERVAVLEEVDPDVLDELAAAGDRITELEDPQCSNDDLLDAFVLAVTASDLTGPLRTLPDEPETDEEGLRMEIVYAEP